MTFPRRARLVRLGAVLAAGAVFALAYFSPIETVDSDPAIALLVSQTLIDHHTLALDVYRGNPACAYDLDTDYRLRRIDGVTTYYSPSVAVLSLPFVWLANRFGYHMLDQSTELAAQNLLSAMCCAMVFLILYGACRAYLDRPASYLIAAVTVLGSPLISTVATGLWNSAYAAVFLSLAVLHLARRDAAGPGRTHLNYPYLAVILTAAFIARPASAFAILATFVYLLGERDRRVSRLAAGALGLLVATVFAAWAGWMDWLPTAIYYYSPTRLYPRTSLGVGLAGTLWSPSRGLLVFCPFVVALATGAVWQFNRLRQHRLFIFSLVWISLYVPAVATRPIWWGGHSFGPRLYTELMPAFLLLTCLLWRELRGQLAGSARAVVSMLYVTLGLVAILIHSGQGLFNPYAQHWNTRPNVDPHPELVFDWRHPQFLASEALLEHRIVEHQRRTFGTYTLGQELAHDTPDALFLQWYPPEDSWRWSRGHASSIVLRLGEIEGHPLYLLDLSAGTLIPQEVSIEINGTAVEPVAFDGFGPTRHLIPVSGHLLRSDQENTVLFHIPEVGGTTTDPRQLGLALRSLSLRPLSVELDHIQHTDDLFFLEGWSSAEASWRWSDGDAGVLGLATGQIGPGPQILELTTGALGRQRIRWFLDDKPMGELIYEGFAPTSQPLEIPAGLLQSHRMHHLRLETPDAMQPPGESRKLGLAFVSLRLVKDPQ